MINTNVSWQRFECLNNGLEKKQGELVIYYIIFQNQGGRLSLAIIIGLESCDLQII